MKPRMTRWPVVFQHLWIRSAFLVWIDAVEFRPLVYTVWGTASRLNFAFYRSFLPIIVGYFV